MFILFVYALWSRIVGSYSKCDVTLSELWELVMDREAWHAVSWGFKESDTTELLN